MRIANKYLPGSVLPTVVMSSVLILTAMLGLFMLWEQEISLFVRSCRLRQARADVESAYTLYRLHSEIPTLTQPEGYLLYDSLPQSRVRIAVRPWGLYDAVSVTTADSLLCVCRLFGSASDVASTLYYPNGRSALTLAGRTELRGELYLPRNGLIYGRLGADFFCGKPIPNQTINLAEDLLPQPIPMALGRIVSLFSAPVGAEDGLPDSLNISFLRDSTHRVRLGRTALSHCTLRGQIVLYADELRIDSTCRFSHLLVCARKITVASGTRIAAQFFARDTVIVESRAVLEYPSGIYTNGYAEVGARARVDGYVIVRDTMTRKNVAANYRQSRTARVRGMVWIDGIAQVQGLVSGSLSMRCATYFSPQGYYQDMLYDLTLLENPHTARPVWLSDDAQRKEALCVR